MKEEWKPIVGYEGLYEVSNYGQVRSLRFSEYKIMSQHTNHKGYKIVGLYKNGKEKLIPVHRLVAIAFILNPENLPQVNHKDENKANNCVENLEWCTREYNINYGTATQRRAKKHWIPIIATDKNGKDTFYTSIKEAARKNKVSTTCISQCCRRIQGRITVKGYTWRYANENKHNYYVELRKKTAKKKATPVIAMDKNGNETYFMSIKYAIEQTGANRTSLIRSCRDGKYRSVGFKWRYATKEEKQQHSNSLII